MSRSDFFVHLYGPSLAGVPATLLLAFLRDRAGIWVPGWTGLLIGAMSVALAVGSSVWCIDSFLPGHGKRQSDLLGIGAGLAGRRIKAFVSG